jgi:hypothetical protein
MGAAAGLCAARSSPAAAARQKERTVLGSRLCRRPPRRLQWWSRQSGNALPSDARQVVVRTAPESHGVTEGALTQWWVECPDTASAQGVAWRQSRLALMWALAVWWRVVSCWRFHCT